MPGEGGKLQFDFTIGGLTSFANSQASTFSELDNYNVVDNLNLGESITPEKREELRRLSEKFNEKLANLSDEAKQAALQEMANDMNAAIDSTFANNKIDINTEAMARFFKFDPSVQPEDNFLAKLGGYISLVRGENPDGAFGPRVTQLLDKFINLTGDLSTSMAGSDGLAKAKLSQTVGGKPPTSGGGVGGVGSGGGTNIF
jgi:hypothetical protein